LFRQPCASAAVRRPQHVARDGRNEKGLIADFRGLRPGSFLGAGAGSRFAANVRPSAFV